MIEPGFYRLRDGCKAEVLAIRGGRAVGIIFRGDLFEVWAWNSDTGRCSDTLTTRWDIIGSWYRSYSYTATDATDTFRILSNNQAVAVIECGLDFVESVVHKLNSYDKLLDACKASLGWHEELDSVADDGLYGLLIQLRDAVGKEND